MTTPSGSRNGRYGPIQSANIVKIIICTSLLALFHIRAFGGSYSDGYTKGLRNALQQGNVQAVHKIEEVPDYVKAGSSSEANRENIQGHDSTMSIGSPSSHVTDSKTPSGDKDANLDTIEVVRSGSMGETLESQIVENDTIVQTREEEEGIGNETMSKSTSISMETSLEVLFNDTETQSVPNEESHNRTEDDLSSSLSMEMEIATMSSSNETRIIQDKDKQQDIEFRSQSKPTVASSSNETMISSDSYRNSSSIIDPIISTDNSTRVQTNASLEETQSGNMVNQNNSTSKSQTITNETETENGISAADKQYELWNSTKAKFYDTKPWQNSSTFTRVDRGVYRQIVEKAQASVKSLVDDVYTDCEMYILPNIDEDRKVDENSPKVQYKCLGDDNPVLQDDLCHTVNLCRVTMDEDAWYDADDSITNSTVDTISSSDKSTLLMIVDSVEYMMKANTFQGVMNKASYAYRSNRSFYIWIGNLDEDELNNREVESLAPAFGFRCAAKELKNSMHYYKPIAFLVLFDILASSSQKNGSVFYLDADSAFTPVAFERIEDDKFDWDRSERVDFLGPIGPESYLGLSPQASLMATQNIKGRMLMNSGLILLRDTQWAREFSALWWFGRCGYKDQLALWLVLYVTFSAWTSDGESSTSIEEENVDIPAQFAYPGDVFFDYAAANQKLFMHFRSNAHSIQAAWETVIERQQKQRNSSDIVSNNENDYAYPIPTNTKRYNGGSWNLGPKLFAPMELPHVVILSPVRAISYNKTIQNSSQEEDIVPEQVDLPRLKAEEGGDSLVVHSKTMDGCTDFRCWPYVGR